MVTIRHSVPNFQGESQICRCIGRIPTGFRPPARGRGAQRSHPGKTGRRQQSNPNRGCVPGEAGETGIVRGTDGTPSGFMVRGGCLPGVGPSCLGPTPGWETKPLRGFSGRKRSLLLPPFVHWTLVAEFHQFPRIEDWKPSRQSPQKQDRVTSGGGGASSRRRAGGRGAPGRRVRGPASSGGRCRCSSWRERNFRSSKSSGRWAGRRSGW